MTADRLEAPGPLSGLRVLELADEKGHFCGKLMGDLGADVVKIEPPGGERTRRVGPFLDDVPHPERSLSFWHYNTSKRSITLNLETGPGAAFFQRLAAKVRHCPGNLSRRLFGVPWPGLRAIERAQPGTHRVFADPLRPDRPLARLSDLGPASPGGRRPDGVFGI